MAWLHRCSLGTAVAVVWALVGASTVMAQNSNSWPVVRLVGVEYVDVRAIANRYNLSASWSAQSAAVRLSDARTRLIFKANSREFQTDGVRAFLGEPVVRHRNSLYVSRIDVVTWIMPLLQPGAGVPRSSRPEVIAIDAGHGGPDAGAANRRVGVNEKTVVFDLAKRLKLKLEGRGYRVVLTRERDIKIPLQRRPELANRASADLFVSLHFNSLPSAPAVRGIETYTLTPQGLRSTADAIREPDDRVVVPGHRFNHWNTVLSAAIHRRLLASLHPIDRGMRRARFVVLERINCPAVLVELGFLSNAAEARKIATPAYRTQLAQALADGIDDYRSSISGRGNRLRAKLMTDETTPWPTL
ncbi:MAG: N-acetylmuramoyl-L-alanine amidase [Opitutaceae bacterium]|nr:N-acetylmuramoyl-L-alanine amidase [Opitutaceae bacterium]